MNRLFFSLVVIIVGFSSCVDENQPTFIIQKGNINYDFSFAELAIKYLETEDPKYIKRIANLDATAHLMNHAKRFDYNIPKKSEIDLVASLLSPTEEKRKVLIDFKRNLLYAKDNIARNDIAQKVCLAYLPNSFDYKSNLYFTFGYDLGVVFGNNASINLAHPNYIKNMNELKYYAIHELHHAGFVILKNNVMPSLEVTNYGEMAKLIEYFTHLEGMGTFAPLEIRMKENAMNMDSDYISLQNVQTMEAYEKEFFEIYFHFKNNPNEIITDEDWNKVSILSDEKRLWYRIGALMAKTIDINLGRDKLVGLIAEDSANFISTYLSIEDK